MGNTIWLQVNDGTTTTGDDRDNSFLLSFKKELDTIAKRLGVTKLSTFYDNGSLREELEAEWSDLRRDAAARREVWFAAGQGHACFAALLQELRRNPGALRFKADKSRSHWPAALMDDLTYCEAALREAAAHGRRFRLLLVA